MYQGHIIKANKTREIKNTKSSNVSSYASLNEGEASKIIAKAKEKAQEIRQQAILEAETEKEQILKQAHNQAELAAAEKLLKVSRDIEEEMSTLEFKLAEIISDCVKAIIGSLPDKQIQRAIVKTALEKIINRYKVSIKIPPADYENRWWENWDWAKDNNLDESIFEKDDSVPKGRLLISFADQEIDIGIDTQLSKLKKIASMRNQVKNANNDGLARDL